MQLCALRVAIGLWIMFVGASCAGGSAVRPAFGPAHAGAPVEPPPAPGPTRQVVLVTIDGMRWQELFLGVDHALAREAGLPRDTIVGARELTPRMHARFFDRGGVVLGAPGQKGGIAATGPNFCSLPGYLEILRGHPTEGCVSNECPVTFESTILDDVRALPKTEARDVAAFTSWESCARAASSSPEDIVLSSGRTGGTLAHLSWVDATEEKLLADARACATAPGSGDYRPDRVTAPIALRYLVNVHPRMLWLALGDTDEWGHRADYGSYLGAIRYADQIVGAIVDRLASAGEYGRETTLIVTTDHGRGPAWTQHGLDPSCAPVWLLAAGGAVPARGVLGAKRAYRLADVAPTIRALLGLPADRSDGAGSPIEDLIPSAGARLSSP